MIKVIRNTREYKINVGMYFNVGINVQQIVAGATHNYSINNNGVVVEMHLINAISGEINDFS